MGTKVDILIIDDNEIDRKSIERSLNKANFSRPINVEGVPDKASSLKLLKQKLFSCIYLDYQLKECDGLDLLKEIRGLGIRTPIIVVTSQGDEQIALKMIKAGANDFIPKEHITPEVLFHSMRNIFRIVQLEEEKSSINRSLMQTEERLEKAVSNADIILFSYDSEGILQYVGGKGLELINVAEGEIINRSYIDIYKNQNEMIKVISAAFDGNKGRITKDINNYTFDIDFSPLLMEDKKVDTVIGVARNVTERALMQEKLIVAKELAVKAAKMKEQFLANMSHEIRTPMNAIIGFTDLLMYTKLEKEQKEHVNAIQISSKNLLTLINDILDFSKIEAEKLVLEQVDFNIQLLMREVEKVFRPKLDEKRLGFVLEVDHELPMNLTGDPIRLNQIIWNLIGNAIKFTDKGEITFSVAVKKMTKKDILLEFKVKDTGIGMNQENLDQIWEHFAQASNNTSRLYGGTGLGLTIAKNLVKLQKGSISVSSEKGIGTEFLFEIPFIVSDIIIGDKSKVKKLLRKTFSKSEKYNVLVMEDNMMNQLLAKKVLQNFNYDFTICDNGKLGVEELERNNYDLILMDIQMPEMNGYEAAKYIREKLKGKKQQIPIIAMTAFAMAGEKEKCADYGMNDYISKPFRAEVLKQKIIDTIRAVKQSNQK